MKVVTADDDGVGHFSSGDHEALNVVKRKHVRSDIYTTTTV